MDIERINEDTIKLYISYLDIEDLGFKREEIWYDRERSEQLFWQMIEEVHKKEDDFVFEGPLWIQIQALENGIEVIVTKSRLSEEEKSTLAHQEEIENILGNGFLDHMNESSNNKNKATLSTIVSFTDFEYIIRFSDSYHHEIEGIKDILYHYNDKYYLQLEFSEELYDQEKIDNFMSQLLEYANDTNISIYVLEEYGKVIFSNKTLAKVIHYFSS